jgi:rubrerythrin
MSSTPEELALEAVGGWLEPLQPIRTVDRLKQHLMNAAAVELSTIPLYLYAAYSIKTSGYSQWDPGNSAFRTIRSVVIEEMLHLCLARNLLVAIGGDVRFYNKDFVFTYPNPMLHHVPKLCLNLEPCTQDLMRRVFMPLEHPMKTGARPEPGWYETLGQFYAAIEDGFQYLDDNDKDKTLWKDTHPELQYGRAYWNDDGGGAPILVTDLKSAKLAIRTIVEQGEGESKHHPPVGRTIVEHGEGESKHNLYTDDPHTPAAHERVPISFKQPTEGLDELSHYAKFARIAQGIDRIGDVYPVPINPHREDFKDEVGDLATLFDAAYCYVLALIDAVYHTPTVYGTPTEPQQGGAGKPIKRYGVERSQRYGLERSFIAAMGGLLFPIADLLVRTPQTKGSQQHAAPCFGFYEFDGQSTFKEQLDALCDRVLGHYPSLGGDDGVHQLIKRLPDVQNIHHETHA